MANFNGEHVTKLTQLYNMLMGLWNSAKGLFATQAELTRVEQSIPDAQVQSDWDETDTDSKAYIKHKPNIPEMQVQSDWTEADTSSKAYIKHKPENLVQDASYVHTDNNFTTAEKTKLEGIEAGAEVNVQADWNQSNSSADDYIKNKPENLVQDADYVHTDNNFTTAEKTKLEGIAAGAEVNVQADWNQSNSSADDYIKNKPENLVQDASYVHTDNNFTTVEKDKLSGIEAGAEVNVQADWNQSDTTADDYIKNKPSNATTSTDGFMSAADKTKLNGIAAGAEVNVQSDWTQNDTSADDYIKHKPALYGLVPGTGINIELNQSEQVVISANNDPQVQSDWTETNTSSKAYIQNKPVLARVATTGSYNDLTNKPTLNSVPNVASADNGKVLTAEYSGGVGSYSWQVAPISLPPSTTSDEGKTLVVDSSGDPSWAIIQSDWSQSNNAANDYIKNKPLNMPLKAGNRISFAYVDDQLEISAAAASQVQSDWDQSDSSAVDYIKNKPTIPAAQVNADWNSSSGVSEILNKPNLATVATSGDYDDLTNKPTIPAAQVQSDYAQTDSTAVDYIKNKPTLFSGNYNDLTNKPDLSIYAESSDLASVATSGSYNDLSNKPTIPAAQVNSDWNASSGVAEILNKPNLAAVATSGSYNDLSNTPTIPDGVPTVTSSDNGKVLKATYSGGTGSYSWETESGGGGGTQVQSNWTESDPTAVSYIQNKPNLATVATSGSYNDLTNTPTIPAAQVNADWNSSSGVSEILNKPNLAAVATSGSYNDLSNKPTIPTVDQTYNSSSSNAQSGVAVASAISGKQDTISAGNMINISSNAVGVSTTAGITDIVKVQALPANPVATVLYLIEE